MDIFTMKRLVRATRSAFDAAEALSSDKLSEIYGDLLDVVYSICGERTDEITDSLTYKLIIWNRQLTDEQAAETLLAMA
jgi:hypothetical protein